MTRALAFSGFRLRGEERGPDERSILAPSKGGARVQPRSGHTAVFNERWSRTASLAAQSNGRSREARLLRGRVLVGSPATKFRRFQSWTLRRAQRSGLRAHYPNPLLWLAPNVRGYPGDATRKQQMGILSPFLFLRGRCLRRSGLHSNLALYTRYTLREKLKRLTNRELLKSVFDFKFFRGRFSLSFSYTLRPSRSAVARCICSPR